jgi:predicted metalloendopeptidase
VFASVTGRQFDKDGNMMQWWNNVTVRAFRDRAQCIIDQYSKYKLEEVDLYVNGRMTQGENIADNGGLKQSFRVSPSGSHGDEYEDCCLLGCCAVDTDRRLEGTFSLNIRQ